MNGSVLLSVIIPVYNRADYLNECVESVRNEKVREVEILLLDDGSTDNSEEECRRIEALYPEVKYYKLEHAGVSATRNKGIDLATGKYVFFLDSDDRIEKGLIDSLLEKMEANDAIMGNSLLRNFGSGRRTHCTLEKELPDVLEDDETIEEFLSGGNSLMAIGGKMMLRSKIGDYRFRTDLPAGEDTYFIYDFIRQGGKTVFVNHCFYEYRIHEGNTIMSFDINCFYSVFEVKQYLYDRECERVGAEQAESIWLQHADIMRNWMKRCRVYDENTKNLRKAISEQNRKIKTHPLYPKLGRRFRVRVFTFTHMFPVYRLIYAGKMDPVPSCCGCAACMDVCPVGAIQMKQGKDGFSYPETDHDRCTDCSLCDKICPLKQEHDVKVENQYYALQATDPRIRETSTSGGAFRLLAEKILARGGAVVGASMEQLSVKHIVVEQPEDLKKLSGSKYVQSNTEGIYKRVKQMLDSEREVLFSGTPCQVDALIKYLGREYRNLYLVDLICYGVASPAIWKRYVKYLEKKYKCKLTGFSFRDKREHDDGHTIAAEFADGERTWSMYTDKFCLSYFRNLTIRKQCSECPYCTDQRKSDLTIGDLWGVEKSYPQINDGMGTSLVIVHSDQGRELFREISDEANVFEISKDEAKQPRLYYPIVESSNARIAKIAADIMPLRLWFKVFVK